MGREGARRDGTVFLAASEPAIASIGTIIRKRPISIARPSVVLYQGVLALSPAKAEPLLPCRRVGVEDLGEAVRPWLLRSTAGEARPDHTAIAVKPRIVSGRTRMASIAILTSFASIFLPRYSGVRPTIRPAMKTARMAKISMP